MPLPEAAIWVAVTFDGLRSTASRTVGLLLVLTIVVTACGGRVSETGHLPLRTVTDLTLPGDTSRFDYASLDTDRHRLFVAHLGAGEVVLVDTAGPSVSGVVGDLPGVHGVLVLPELGRVLAAVTARNEVAVLDEDSGSVLATVPTGQYPDGLAFDAADSRAFVSNEVGGSVTAIVPSTGDAVGTVDLGAEVGNVVYDTGSGQLLAAVQGRDEVAVIDPRTLAVTARHHLAGCAHPHGLAVVADETFVACDGNARLLVVDTATGTVRNRFTVGSGPDVLAYDAGLGRLYVMAESGVTAVLAVKDGSVSLLGRRMLAANAHSVAVDPGTHLLYVPLHSVGGRPILRVYAPT
jgi:DNA-binding beta-propeller fold protein YncE